jgi:hypothetical protein
MRTTLALDDELVAKAHAFTGHTEKSSLVREALKALLGPLRRQHRFHDLIQPQPKAKTSFLKKRSKKLLCSGAADRSRTWPAKYEATEN